MGVERPINQSVTGKRRAKRARVLLSAKLETQFGDVEARLRDLSAKGALVECVPTPPTGTELLFVRGDLAVPSRVAWSQPGRAGLEFDYPIDENDILVQVKPRKAQITDRFRRPAIRSGMTEQERKLAAAWGVTVGINLPDEDL